MVISRHGLADGFIKKHVQRRRYGINRGGHCASPVAMADVLMWLTRLQVFSLAAR
jgi:hypothetical protein